MNEYESYDAVGLAELVRRREVTPSELLDAALERLAKWNPLLNAVPILWEERARRAIEAGLPEGPFRGVPFLIKDLHLQVAGERLTNGCGLYADYRCPHDSELVRRYRAAGLVDFGRSASPEFGTTCTTESRLFGATANPWNRAHSSGGSSGGASAAVAAGILPLANASDGGGSIRIPAANCGLFGIKPTRGRTPLAPDAGEGWAGMSAVHAVSRSVRDSAALLDATAGPAAGDPYVAPAPVRPWLDEVGRPPGRLRIALQTSTLNGMPTHPDCVAAAEEAAELCRSLGHEVVERPFETDRAAFARACGGIISASLRATLEDRAAALGRPLAEEDVEPGSWKLVGLGGTLSAGDYLRAVKTIHAVGRELARFFEDVDLLLTPTLGAPPQPLGVLSLSNPDASQQVPALLQAVGFTQLANAAGTPAMSVPLCWNAAGLPIGTMFTGRYGEEATLFRLAGQLEEARPWFERRPPLA